MSDRLRSLLLGSSLTGAASRAAASDHRLRRRQPEGGAHEPRDGVRATKTGDKVELNFGATGHLLAQIREGAPVDVFIAASDEQMDQAERRSWSIRRRARSSRATRSC